MKKSITLLFLLFSILSFAQQPAKDKQNMKVLTDSEPAYPKGDNELYSYVLHNVSYPEESKKKYVEGEVTLSFDVKTDSTVSNVIVLSGVGYGVDQAVKTLVEKLKFAPAIQNGFPVKMNTTYSFPVKAH